jgi:hypothetical protein
MLSRLLTRGLSGPDSFSMRPNPYLMLGGATSRPHTQLLLGTRCTSRSTRDLNTADICSHPLERAKESTWVINIIPGYPKGAGPEAVNTGPSIGSRSMCSWIPDSRAAPAPRNDGPASAVANSFTSAQTGITPKRSCATDEPLPVFLPYYQVAPLGSASTEIETNRPPAANDWLTDLEISTFRGDDHHCW